jgi:hypothetical protein
MKILGLFLRLVSLLEKGATMNNHISDIEATTSFMINARSL